jgi:hypothetical protein
MGSGAAHGQFKSWRAALMQCQELAGRKRALLRVVSTGDRLTENQLIEIVFYQLIEIF